MVNEEISVTVETNLWNAVELVARAWTEIESMQAELAKNMALRMEKEGNKLGFNSETGESCSEEQGDGWVRTMSIMQWGLKPKGSGKKVIGNLSIQVVLWSEEADLEIDGKIPRVEVAYFGYSTEKIGASEMGPGTWFNSEGWDYLFPNENGSHLAWRASGDFSHGVRWDERSNWIYSIPLVSVGCSDDIDRLIISPAMKLLAGVAPIEALKDIRTIKQCFGKDGKLHIVPK